MITASVVVSASFMSIVTATVMTTRWAPQTKLKSTISDVQQPCLHLATASINETFQPRSHQQSCRLEVGQVESSAWALHSKRTQSKADPTLRTA